MKRENNQHAGNAGGLLVFILTAGVFGIINTEMGVVGILPQIAQRFQISVPDAGWTVGLFALIVALSAPVMPVLFSRVNRRTVMLLALGTFTLSNLVSAFTDSFTVMLIVRPFPPFFTRFTFPWPSRWLRRRQERRRLRRRLPECSSVYRLEWFWAFRSPASLQVWHHSPWPCCSLPP